MDRRLAEWFHVPDQLSSPHGHISFPLTHCLFRSLNKLPRKRGTHHLTLQRPSVVSHHLKDEGLCLCVLCSPSAKARPSSAVPASRGAPSLLGIHAPCSLPPSPLSCLLSALVSVCPPGSAVRQCGGSGLPGGGRTQYSFLLLEGTAGSTLSTKPEPGGTAVLARSTTRIRSSPCPLSLRHSAAESQSGCGRSAA